MVKFSIGARGFWNRSDGLHSLTLKFPEPQTEREFVRHSTAEILNIFFCSGVVVLAVFASYIALAQFLDLGIVEVYQGQKTDQNIARAVMTTLFLLLVVAGKIPCLLDVFSPLAFECMAMLVVIFLCSYQFVMHGPFMARLKGHEFPGCSHDAVLLLNLCGMLVFAHVFLPIRWCTLIPAQIYPVVFYAVYRFHFAAPECSEIADFPVYGPSKNWMIANLTAVIVVASVGKRKVEVQARELFMRLITERTHRAEREFQLGQLRQPVVPPSLQAEPSLPDSLPTTTQTNRVFEISGDVATPQQLAAIAEIGLKEHWLIDAADLAWTPDSILGVGGFGIVTAGTYLGMSIAIKVPRYSLEACRHQSSVVDLCNELKILRRLGHPNIVAFYGACVDAQFKDLALVIELVTGASLRDFVSASPCDVDKVRILHEISCALCYLHTQTPQIVHGDLKDANCYVQQCGHQVWGAAKLLDFSLARQITKRARPLGGSLAWMAPEVAVAAATQARPGTAADIFSLGRLTYFVATGVPPAHGRDRNSLLRQLRSGAAPALAWPAGSAAGGGFACGFRDIVDRCSMSDPSSRPSSIDVRTALAEKRRECMGQQRAQPQADLNVQLQAVRMAATRWQRRASHQIHRHWESICTAPQPRPCGAQALGPLGGRREGPEPEEKTGPVAAGEAAAGV